MEKSKTILDLSIGQSAKIKNFGDDQVALRLISLGMIPGYQITLIRKSLFSGSFYLKFHNQRIAIRRDEAKSIYVEE